MISTTTIFGLLLFGCLTQLAEKLKVPKQEWWGWVALIVVVSVGNHLVVRLYEFIVNNGGWGW